MWRLLLQAGLGFATFDVGRRIANARRKAVFFAVAGVVGLLGLGALTAAAIVALEPRLGLLGSASVVGGVLLLVAILIAAIGSRDPAPPRSTSTPIVDRVRSELGAAGAALSSVRSSRAEGPPAPGAARKKAINMVLIATLAGIVLGRRL